MKRKKLIKSPILEYRYENLIEILQMTVSNYRQDSHYYHYHNCWEVIIIQQGMEKPRDFDPFGQTGWSPLATI